MEKWIKAVNFFVLFKADVFKENAEQKQLLESIYLFLKKAILAF